MNPEDASEHDVSGLDAPDGIIEIEYYNVAPVSNAEAGIVANVAGQTDSYGNDSAGIIASNDTPDGIIEIEDYELASVSYQESSGDFSDGIIETESYKIPTADEMAYSKAVVDETITATAETSNSGTIEIGIKKSGTVQEDSSTVASSPINKADIVAPTPVSNMTNEASSMANEKPTTSSGDNFEDWVIMPETAWPPPIFMKKNVSPKERFYLEYRWHSQWSFYDSKATQNKNTYYYLQRIVVIGSLIIPALISLNSTIARFITEFIPTQNAAETETFVRIGVDAITVIISLAVAGAASLESLYKYGENWSSYRSAAEELQAEKNFYDMGAGPYAASQNPFATFVDRVEGIVANQNGKYFQAVQSQIAKQSAENDEIVASFKSGDDDEYELSVSRQAAKPEPEPEYIPEPAPEVASNPEPEI